MIRLSEKTIEINFCSQLSYLVHNRIIWFGLTQRQEARLGFDVCTKLNGKLFIFQFKASNLIVNGLRRFYAPHNQMMALRSLCGVKNRLVYYVFPMIGNSTELTQNPDIINHSWVLDVSDVPSLPFPTTSRGTRRSKGIHYVDVSPPTAIIHSEPKKLPLYKANEVVKELLEKEGLMPLFEGRFEKFDEILKMIGRKAYGAILLKEDLKTKTEEPIRKLIWKTTT